MHWLLIAIWSYGTSPAVLTERFPNQTSCERARKWFIDNEYGNPAFSICLEDFDK